MNNKQKNYWQIDEQAKRNTYRQADKQIDRLIYKWFEPEKDGMNVKKCPNPTEIFDAEFFFLPTKTFVLYFWL